MKRVTIREAMSPCGLGFRVAGLQFGVEGSWVGGS